MAHKGRYVDLKQTCIPLKNSSSESLLNKTHDFLFEQPVALNWSGKPLQTQYFENMYLAIEFYLSRNFNSINEVHNYYEDLSEPQLKTKGQTHMDDLEMVTNNFYKNLLSTSDDGKGKSYILL